MPPSRCLRLSDQPPALREVVYAVGFPVAGGEGLTLTEGALVPEEEGVPRGRLRAAVTISETVPILPR